jgi:hypothetical protein
MKLKADIPSINCFHAIWAGGDVKFQGQKGFRVGAGVQDDGHLRLN